MKRLLLISYYFPPDGGGGTQRAAKFAKYLPMWGWEPVVLTRDAPARRTRWEPIDQALHHDIQGVSVYRVPAGADEGAIAMHPQRRKGVHPWLARADEAARAIVAEAPIDAVLMTMPPYGMAELARLLRRWCEVPIVIDLRDPWAMDGAPLYASRAQWRFSRDVMHRTLQAVDGIIANTPEAETVLRAAVPTSSATRWTTIPNGFDGEDFRGLPATPPKGFEAGAFHLVHAGTFHSPAYAKQRGLAGRLRRLKQHRARRIDVSGRTPLHLLRAIRLLQRRGAANLDRLRLTFAGIADPASDAMVRDAGLDSITRFTGYLTHPHAVHWMSVAGANFLPLHGLPPGQRSRIVPGKLYEYLAAGRPILGAVPPGDACDLIGRCGRGAVAAPTDAGAIADALAGLLVGEPGDADTAWLAHFERSHLTGKLATFLDAVTQSTGSPAEKPDVFSGAIDAESPDASSADPARVTSRTAGASAR